MTFKKKYIKPQVTKVALDKSITLMMMSNPTPRGNSSGNKGTKGTDQPFASPFGDKPFS